MGVHDDQNASAKARAYRRMDNLPFQSFLTALFKSESALGDAMNV
jgi:hypothetical protein